MRIETPRLLLRPWREEEAQRLLEFFSRPDLVAWMSEYFDQPETLSTVEEAEARVRRFNDRVPPQLQLAIEPRSSDGTPVGTVSLCTLPNGENGEVEIGWWLHEDALGHGYATEAAAAVLRYGFDSGYAEIFAVTYPDNTPSQQVARRIGMTDIGLHERWYPGESRLFRATAADWQEPSRQSS